MSAKGNKGTQEIQARNHRQSTYQRPNMQWQCGRLDACQYGPNGNGRCGQLDSPCQPKRTLRAKKRLIAIGLFLFALFSIALLLTLDGMLARISPGPLSASHSEVASCQDCHSAAGLSISDWVKNVVKQGGHNDDLLCLECHGLGNNAFLPHSTEIISNARFLNAKEIQGLDNQVSGNQISGNQMSDSQSKVSERIDNAVDEGYWSANWMKKSADSLYRWQSDEQDNLSCSTCHREHKNESGNLTDFEAGKCHTCHDVKFDSVDQGHPEFSNFPHVQSTNIRFDHAAHLNNYFYDDDSFDVAPAGCTSCHATDQTGEWMLSSSFEETCSSCHLGDIMGNNRATEKGVVVLSVPEIDIASLQQAGFNVGQWPAWADGELSPFMQVLLPGYQAELFNSITLYDLTNASDEQLTAVAKLAWDIKTLFYEIQVGGTNVINRRLSEVYQQSVDGETASRLIAALPRDTLLNNQLEWFPDLMTEMQRYQQGLIGIKTTTLGVGNEANLGGENLGGEMLSADIDAEQLQNEVVESSANDEILLEDDEISLNDDQDILFDDELSLSDDDELLLDDDGLNLSDDEDIGDIESEAIVTAANAEEWAVTGGWYRDGSSIRYRPVGHNDTFFKTWLDISAHDTAGISQRIFSTLNQPESVGNCIMCHSVEQPLTQRSKQSHAMIHWVSFKPSDVIVDFNRFSHVSHFSLMTDDGCSSCHLVATSDNLIDNGFVNEDDAQGDIQKDSPTTFTSGFEDMPQTTCTQCHQPGRAPDDCLTCHNYHAERQRPAIEQINDALRQGQQARQGGQEEIR